jgi:hypothetical protein
MAARGIEGTHDIHIISLQMVAVANANSAAQDWRLDADLKGDHPKDSLHALVRLISAPPTITAEIESVAPQDVVFTHDGAKLFAYAANETLIHAACQSAENVLQSKGIIARMSICHWDDEHNRWKQIVPPLDAQEQTADEASMRNADTVETRTLVASSGKLIRAEFEQTMTNWAAELGLQCRLIEHPHLLTTQVAFTLTGPRGKITEFSDGLAAEGRATIRTDTAVMLSPL